MIPYILLTSGSGSSDPTLANYIDTGLISKIGTMITTIVGWITSNPVLALFFTVSFVFLGFKLIGKLKGVMKVH